MHRLHIAIFPPQVHDAINPEYLYVNRKGYHSINVQLVIVYLFFCSSRKLS